MTVVLPAPVCPINAVFFPPGMTNDTFLSTHSSSRDLIAFPFSGCPCIFAICLPFISVIGLSFVPTIDLPFISVILLFISVIGLPFIPAICLPFILAIALSLDATLLTLYLNHTFSREISPSVMKRGSALGAS